ncbi:hypothetical protein [Cytobacillus oceanisediminis]|uniref:hypothetical protein n=1 Tax=Cytobacillus oceanisediminis TaxID=665099 RepID=UPI00204195F7|nr:hypothetical protein [Cytobacillus oceanisediminis]MCM3395943.1 hypothetical protein [Cytobacillus oceanisediminis]
MKKNYLRRNKWNILLFIFYGLLLLWLYRENHFSITEADKSYHLNLLTINSIFVGFLFTSLGIMAGFADKKIIASLDKAGYMDNYYNSIYTGLFFHVISTVLSALGVTIEFFTNNEYVLIAQQVTLIGGILFFVKAVWNIFKIIGKIRRSL